MTKNEHALLQLELDKANILDTLETKTFSSWSEVREYTCPNLNQKRFSDALKQLPKESLEASFYGQSKRGQKNDNRTPIESHADRVAVEEAAIVLQNRIARIERLRLTRSALYQGGKTPVGPVACDS